MIPVLSRATFWFRLLLLQSAWSYRRQQSPGWLFVALPLARRHGQAPAPWLKSIAVYFNTHPLLAPLVMGAALRTMHDQGIGGADAAKGILVRWMGTFGALGDLLYWRVAAWNFAWIAVAAWAAWGIHGVVAVAIAVTVIEIAVRIALFEFGWRRPAELKKLVARADLQRRRATWLRTGLIGTAAAAGWAFGVWNVADQPPLLDLAAGGGAVVGAWLAGRYRFRSAVVWIPLIVAALVRGLS